MAPPLRAQTRAFLTPLPGADEAMDKPTIARTFRQALRHAFAIPENQHLSPEERQWLERIADRVVRRGLAAPAIFMLQAAKPLNFVGSQLIVFFKPIISMVVPPAKCDQAAELLSRRHSVEALLQMIEQRDAENRRAGMGGRRDAAGQ